MHTLSTVPKAKSPEPKRAIAQSANEQISASNVEPSMRAASCACGGGCARCNNRKNSSRGILQAKLEVGAPDDAYEQEADRVADEILATPSSNAIKSKAPPLIQRLTSQTAGYKTTAPSSVESVLSESGRSLDTELQQEMSQRFGQDFSEVRIHTGTAAEKSAQEISAHAYTVGRNIVFGAGEFSPNTNSGKRLLAHELTHVVQQSNTTTVGRPAAGPNIQRHINQKVLQRDAADLAVAFNIAISKSNWDAAVRALMEMSDIDARAGVSALQSDARIRIRNAAARLDPDSSNRVIQIIEGIESASETASAGSTTTSSPSTTSDIARLSSSEKLWRALQYAFEVLDEEAVRELRNLLTPQSLAIMAIFVAAYIAAQLTPIGWVADGIALASLTVAFFFIGRMLFDAIGDVFTFFGAMDAASELQLRTAGRALARAVARVGIQVIILLLTRGLRGARPSGPPAPRTPPPAVGMELLTTEGLAIRVPPEAIGELSPSARFSGRGSGSMLRGPMTEPLPEVPTRPMTRPGTSAPETPSIPEVPTRPTAPSEPVSSRLPTRRSTPTPSRIPRLGEGRIPELMPTPIPLPPEPFSSEPRRRDPGAYPIFWPLVFGPPMLFDVPIIFFARSPSQERDQDYAWEVRRELWARSRGGNGDLMPRDWHAHHVVPLFLGGLEATRGNITFLPSRLHLSGHGQLASQPQMATPPPPLAPLSTNILTHPVGTRYELVGFK